jgi:translation initiation factor eIF-2B subunit gamma
MAKSQGKFQVVLYVDEDDGRLFPMTATKPAPLLHVANFPLLHYQLSLLGKGRVSEVFICGTQEYQEPIRQFLSTFTDPHMRLEFVLVEELLGSADCLRAVGGRIRGDFLCISTDSLFHFPVGEFVDFHRVHSTDMTMLLSVIPSEENDKKGGPPKLLVEEEEQEYIGICEDGRVVMKVGKLEADGPLILSKALCHKVSNMTVRSDLLDMGVYLFSAWVVEFLQAHKEITSIRSELLPFLVARQFQPKEYLTQQIGPCVQHKNELLQEVDTWNVAKASNPNGNADLAEFLMTEDDSYMKTTSTNEHDLLRCYAKVYDVKGSSNSIFFEKLTTLKSYVKLNR